MNIVTYKEALKSEKVKSTFEMLYGFDDAIYKHQLQRYLSAMDSFTELFGEDNDINIFSTSGRTEIGGNHTDHNHGCVLAGSVDLDAIAIAEKTQSSVITIKSEGYEIVKIDTQSLDVVESEKQTTNSLIRGVCARLVELGHVIGGFNAYITSNVLKGSGLSSSAAFEVLIVSILNHLYCGGQIDDVLNAQISQYAENVYFGKPSGLMDQMACAVGGFVQIDFKNPDVPIVEKVNFDFAQSGLSLVITDTGGNHSELTGEYAAIKIEMEKIANALGTNVLRNVSIEDILKNTPMLRESVNDRAILRAIHFMKDNEKSLKEAAALKNGDVQAFLNLVNESGNSSWMYLQNCYVTGNPAEQGVTLALALAKELLHGKGACRVHGGGFAGTIQAFVPKDFADDYIKEMSKVFGENSCYKLYIRPVGTYRLEI